MKKKLVKFTKKIEQNGVKKFSSDLKKSYENTYLEKVKIILIDSQTKMQNLCEKNKYKSNDKESSINNQFFVNNQENIEIKEKTKSKLFDPLNNNKIVCNGNKTNKDNQNISTY